MAVREALLSLVTEEDHWGPAGQTAGKVLGVCAGQGVSHLHTVPPLMAPLLNGQLGMGAATHQLGMGAVTDWNHPRNYGLAGD